MNKIKETNGSPKQQILMKNEEIDQIGQSKAVLEEKNQYEERQRQKSMIAGENSVNSKYRTTGYRIN